MTETVGDAAPDQMLPTSDCSICSHPDAAAIDEALLGGTSIRTVAGTHGVSHSAVGRHKLNHLSVAAAANPPAPTADGKPREIRIVDVHHELASLVDRLEAVVELASRTRKATAAVMAMRELRQTLEAIARTQADPALRKAASGEELRKAIDQDAFEFAFACIEAMLAEAGLTDQVWRSLFSALLRSGSTPDGSFNKDRLGQVDRSAVRAFVERNALEAAARMSAEVKRRVEAELERREQAARRQPLALEAGPSERAVPTWQD
jgi:hypothetical protein